MKQSTNVMDKFKYVWGHLQSFVRNHKYIATVAAFAFFITFIDDNNLIRRMGYNSEIGRLHKEIERYREDYANTADRLNELNANPEELEKIAREKYLMKKPDEDVYVFEED